MNESNGPRRRTARACDSCYKRKVRTSHPGGGVEATSKHSDIQTDPRRSNAMPRRHNVIGVATIICPVHLIV